MTQRNFKTMIRSDQEQVDNGLNVADPFKSWQVADIQNYARENSLPYGVCLMSVTGDLNVGTMIRTAHNMGAERVLVLGRRKYDRRSAVGSEFYTPVVKLGGLNDDNTLDAGVFMQAMETYNYVPVFVETGGELLTSLDWHSYTRELALQEKRPCFVFGNEGRGIPESVLATRVKYDHSKVVSVPQLGVMRSFNVAACASIVLYDVVFTCDAFQLPSDRKPVR